MLRIFKSLFIIFILNYQYSFSQTSITNYNFQSSYNNSKINNKIADSIILLCEQKNIKWPVHQIYLRSFKADNVLEVWVKDDENSKYKFLKSFNVCAKAGKLGPKRKEGDKQVPEGFYYIEKFNPNSNYHLSLGISYPNMSDKILSDAVKPGGDIYIHGDCVSVGCLAINDVQIEELYFLSTTAKNAGQDFIPVHIFPAKFNNPLMFEDLAKLEDDNKDYKPFLIAMKKVFYYFEKEKELPPIFVNNTGNYVLENISIPPSPPPPAKQVFKTHINKQFEKNEVLQSVDVTPTFSGGNSNYFDFVKKLNSDLLFYLKKGQKKDFVLTEFIVNTDGTLSNIQVLKGGNISLNEYLITALENTIDWTPAMKNGKKVNYKMTQTFFIEQ